MRTMPGIRGIVEEHDLLDLAVRQRSRRFAGPTATTFDEGEFVHARMQQGTSLQQCGPGEVGGEGAVHAVAVSGRRGSVAENRCDGAPPWNRVCAVRRSAVSR